MDRTSILITGCSTGIGRCVAEGLRQRGYRVFATARRDEDVAALQHQGFDAHRLDLTEEETIQTTMAWVVEQTGGTLYALFNNGTHGQPGAVEDLPVAALREQFETGLFGWHSLTRKVIPIMRAQGYGRIIQNSSILGLIALPYRGAYVATKHALEGLTDTLRLELHGSGIAISLIEPGPVTTRFRANSLRAFHRWIDGASSIHHAAYARLEVERHRDQPSPFAVPPEAVLQRVIHALESPSPRRRYPVTTPTYLFGMLKRLLTTRALDRLLRRVG